MNKRVQKRIYSNGKVEYVCEEFIDGSWEEMVNSLVVAEEIITRPAVFDTEGAAIEFLCSSEIVSIVSENTIFEL